MPLTPLLSRVLGLRASARLVAVARIITGIAATLAAFEMWRLVRRLLIPTVIKLPYLEWLPLLPSASVKPFILLWVVAAIAFAVGWHARIAGAALVSAIGYSLLMDQQVYSNHLYLLFVIVLLLTIVSNGPRAGRESLVGWPIWLLKIQVSIVYIFSAIAKLTPQYLSGEVLTQSLKLEGFFTVPVSWRLPVAMQVSSVIAIAAEIFVGLGLWSRRLRPAAAIVGVFFHLFIIAALDSSRLSLSIFALAMIGAYLLFFDRTAPDPALLSPKK